MAFKADLIKGFLVLTKALLIFLFCLMSNWMERGILVFGLIIFSGRLLWMFKMVSERIVAALLIMLTGSAFSEEIRLRFVIEE